MTQYGSDGPTPVMVADGPSADAADAEKNKGVAIVGYLGILWLIPMLTAKDSPFAMYHANQGLVLFVCFDIAFVVLWVIPILGWILAPIVGLVRIVFMIMGMINASQGVKKPLPMIGGIQILK